MEENSQTPTRPGFIRRALRRVGIILGTVAVGAIAVGAVMGATTMISANSVKIETETGAPLLTVSTTVIEVQDSYAIPQEFVGQIEPRRIADLGFEAGGTIEEITVDEGWPVSEGTVLATLDTRVLEAQLRQQKAAKDALIAQRDLAELTAKRQEALADRNFASQQRADETRLRVVELDARLAEIDAAITGVEVQLDKSVIRAPFDGLIGRRLADDGARVGPSSPVLEVLERAEPRLRIGLAPEIAVGLMRDKPYTVSIEGQTFDAWLESRRGDIDPRTRTLPVLFELRDADPAALPYGLVTRLSVARDVMDRGAWVPVGALTEGTRGLWNLMRIDRDAPEGPVVVRESVEILYADEDRAYIRGGLTDGMEIVSDGVHRVASGQRVVTAGG
ncbi:MAG: efflux RND transporter periplasmic adaptor subunit [Pseudomonadota bacterium]